jgi:hypothetical protein
MRLATSAFGTFETCRPALRMSVYQGRPAVIGARSERARHRGSLGLNCEELFWQQPIESSQHAQGALLPCAFGHIATKPTPDTSI